jgi:hypothetical protein
MNESLSLDTDNTDVSVPDIHLTSHCHLNVDAIVTRMCQLKFG